MARFLEYAALTAAAIVAVDFAGFTMWVASGQFPVDDFYIGTITAHVLRLFL